jgi:inner membrane protein
MTGRTHDAAAITLLGIIITLHPLPSVTLATALIGILANQIGGIAPDIDQPTAPFWRNLPAEGLLGKFAGKLLGGHRFLTHSILGAGLLAYAAHWLLVFLSPLMPHTDIELVWWAFIIGLASHLIMDTFTKEGVPWLLPIPIKFGFPPIKSLRITTGKFTEIALIFPGLILIDVVLVARHYHAIVMFIHMHVGS